MVEDESIIALDIRSTLTRLGYNVPPVCAGARDAVDEASRLRPDLILMDIHLRGEMTGIDAAREIEAQLKIPIVFLTAYGDEDTLAEARVTKPYGYLLKPFEERSLHVAVEIALDRRAAERERDTLMQRLVDANKRPDNLAQELSRSNADLEQFAYVASHDLQEPLRGVVSYLQLLSRRLGPQIDGEAAEFLQYAIDGGRQMQTMILDLLEFSRVGRAAVKEATDASEALRRAVANLQSQLGETRGTIVEAALPVVEANPGLLTQLFQNLIGNALKFRGSERPRVEVGCEPRGDKWLFSVKDNGIGIEPGAFEKLFQLFQRFHPRERYPGHGIGLALCKKIVERLGGRIWAQSEPGKGSTFFFTLPRA